MAMVLGVTVDAAGAGAGAAAGAGAGAYSTNTRRIWQQLPYYLAKGSLSCVCRQLQELEGDTVQ